MSIFISSDRAASADGIFEAEISKNKDLTMRNEKIVDPGVRAKALPCDPSEIRPGYRGWKTRPQEDMNAWILENSNPRTNTEVTNT